MSTTTPKRRQSLTTQIRLAIGRHDIKALYDLKDICDHIHQTGAEYKGYTIKDLPKDELYEEMVRAIDSSADDVVQMITAEQTADPNVKHRHRQLISDLWMGSITKETTILEIPDALLLPKFDGCSCGIKLKRYISNTKFELLQAVTRGTAEGYNQKQQDITEKFAMLAQPLLSALSSNEANEYKFKDNQYPEKTFGNVLQLTIRGEIVLRDRELTKSAPASVVAGKINGGIEVWQQFINNLEFVPYEIMRFNYDLTDNYKYYVPTQTETLEFFKSMKLIQFPYITANLDANSLSLIQDHFAMLNSTIPQPMDGVVYCASTWRYPTYTEQTKPKQYGKYAWKPTSEGTTTLKGVSFTLSRDGKFNFILSYEPININGKLYRNAKTATSNMVELRGIGVGSVITVKLCGDISPKVMSFINDDNVVPYELPSTCPFCKSKLSFRKAKPATLTCPNPGCPEVLKQKMINFLSTLGIKGVAEGKLAKLASITLELVDTTYLAEGVLESTLTKADTRTYLVALGVGGAQAVSKLLKAKSNMNAMNTVKRNYDAICDFLTITGFIEDPFIEDVLNYTADVLEL